MERKYLYLRIKINNYFKFVGIKDKVVMFFFSTQSQLKTRNLMEPWLTKMTDQRRKR